MKNKIILFFFLIFFFFNFLTPTLAQTQEKTPLNLYFFYSKICPHCKDEALFLSQLSREYLGQINILAFEVTENKANADLFKKFGQKYNINISNVPMLFIGSGYIIGYNDDSSTGAEIKNLIQHYLISDYVDYGDEILNPKQNNSITPIVSQTNIPKKINVPFLGEVNLQQTSLITATLVLGILDGFNPCAMWVLIFLISLLLSIDSPRRRWILGSAFIIASALVYFLFMTAWLNMFLFIGYLLIVRIIIGGLAIGFGIYSLNKYFKNRAGTCEITADESRQKILNKLKTATLNKNLWLAIAGMIGLAFAVNLIELACSAGFPAIYTQILVSQNLSQPFYYFYILFYVLIFMLDDIIVFVVAMVTLRLTGINTKYAKYSNLIGGLVILILGILLILKPEILMFG